MPRSLLRVSPVLSVALAGAAIGLLVPTASAQSWQAGTAASDLNGNVLGLHVWDPDGAGPLAPVLAAIGQFTTAGTTNPANSIATWDGTNWTTFAGSGLLGVTGSQTAGLTSLTSNNNLFAVATGLSQADTVTVKRLAGWNGTGWFSLNTEAVTALVAVGRVNATTLVVAGVFSTVDGVAANRVATWNPTTGWAALDDGSSNGVLGTASACAGLSNGNIVVGTTGNTTGISGGTSAGPVTINRVARWDGAWHGMGAGFTSGTVRCFLELPDGDVICGGAFLTSGTTAVNKIARWDSTTDSWSALGLGINTETSNNRDVYAAVLMPNGDMVVGGDFNTAGGDTHNYIARWNFATSTWSALAPGAAGLNGPVRALAVLPNGDLAVGGDFTMAGGQPANKFAIWDEPAPVHCPADFNNDGVKNVADIFAFLTSWFGECP